MKPQKQTNNFTTEDKRDLSELFWIFSGTIRESQRYSSSRSLSGGSIILHIDCTSIEGRDLSPIIQNGEQATDMSLPNNRINPLRPRTRTQYSGSMTQEVVFVMSEQRIQAIGE